MPANIKFDVKDKGLIEDLKKLSKELRTEITKALDPVISGMVDELKTTLKVMLNSEINLSSTLPDGSKKLPPGANIPKSKADLINFIFDEDISKADYYQRSVGNKTINDNSRVFVMDNGRIKCWQAVYDSSTYADQEMNFRNRLVQGLLIDAKTGSISKIHPDDVKGIKLECSTDTGQTMNSEKKFEAYKNSENISRRKFDGPYNRTAVWTVKQQDAKQLLEGSLPLNQILEKIQEGDYSQAIELFTRNNRGGLFSSALNKLEDLKKGTNLSDALVARTRILTLINNLKVRKTISKYTTKYTLYSNYDSSIEESDDKFFELLKREILMWKLGSEDKLVKALMKAVDKVIAKYTKTSMSE